MSESLFQFNLTLPIMLVVFLGFSQIMRILFFEPIAAIKAARAGALLQKNHQTDADTAFVLEQQAQLKVEELKTQRLIQDAYQARVLKAQAESAKKLVAHKAELAVALEAHIQHETQALQARQDALGTEKEALVQRITEKLLR
jgi:biopolymer transport protein ExbB/TolQ